MLSDLVRTVISLIRNKIHPATISSTPVGENGVKLDFEWRGKAYSITIVEQ